MKHKQTLRRGLSILLSLVLCLSLLPATALAAATGTADFTSGDGSDALALLNAAKTEGAADSTWENNTLTLKGVNFTTTAATAVKLPESAKIVLADGTTNTIASAAENAEMSYGIYATDGLTIEGSGTLIVRSAKATKYTTSSNSYGIYAYAGDITITSGTVVTTGGEAGLSSYGIRANNGSITISGGTVIAASGTANGISYGISASSYHGDITISGGAVAATGGLSYINSGGIGGRNVEISGGTVTAKGGQASSGSCGIVGSTDVKITGGTVTATGSTAGNNSYGIDGTYVTISGGVVTATGGELKSEDANSCGIKTSDNIPITISVGHVIARTQASFGTHMALGAGPDLSKYTVYYWRTSTDASFTKGTYEYSDTHTYVEFSSKNTVTTYSVTVQNDGNGSGSASPANAAAGTEITLSATANNGYRFKEWQVINGTVAITDNKFTMPDSNVTVKAIFEADAPSTTTYTVSFDPNGGGGEMAAVNDVSGDYTLPECTFTAPEGKQFKGWAYSSDGEVISDTSITVNGDTTLYALWEDIPVTTYTVSFDANGGSGSMDAVTVASGKNYTLPACGFTAPSDKQFKGWATSENGEVVTGTINVTKDTTLYAVWEDIPVTTCNETADFTPTDETVISYSLELLKSGGGDASWDLSTKTLTLKGVNFTTKAATAVILPAGAKIVLTDGTENTIANVHGLIGISVGIQANGNITIQGSGTLTVTAGTAAQISCGIYSPDGNVTIKGGTVTATGGETTEASWGSNGIDADGVTISGGTVTATGGKAATNSRGIYASTDVNISGTAKVDATGGTANDFSCGIHAEGYEDSEGNPAGGVTISGGTVTATGGTTGKYSDGIYAYTNVTISGGTVNATGGETTGEESESFGICADVDMDISGGTVTAKGGTAGKYSYGICSYYNETTISGGTVNATGGTATGEESESYGILADTNIKISGGSVTATGSTATDYSFGIFAYATISISDTAEVTATGGTANESFGIESHESEKIIISGGHVIARTLDEENGKALNVKPNLGDYTGYQWRTSPDGDYTVGNFVWDPNYSYVEIVPGGSSGGSSGGSGSSGGGSSTPTYTPSVTQPENGAVTVSPKAPKKGDTVTITPKPEDGYTVEQILVTDKNGDPVKVTNNGDGTYSFTQPVGKVNVEVTFAETEPENPFVDVSANAYYYDAVLWAVENGITTGTGDGTTFSPNAPCTRAQIVTFLWRAAGSPELENVSSFADVPADSYYAKAVAWAVENGITTGTGDGKFSPDATCTRAQAMTFIWRSQKSVAADGVNPFTDVAADAYYADAVLWAVENGVTNGTGDTTFSPNANCTRAQIVTFLYRCLG